MMNFIKNNRMSQYWVNKLPKIVTIYRLQPYVNGFFYGLPEKMT